MIHRGWNWTDPGTGEACFWSPMRNGEDCYGCHKHIREHYGQNEYRCEPRPAAEGTSPGREALIGSRVSVTYQHTHTRKGEPPITETRHAFGKVTSILPDGALWVVTDREGGLRIEATNVEPVQ